jgi:hypothetical protein
LIAEPKASSGALTSKDPAVEVPKSKIISAITSRLGLFNQAPGQPDPSLNEILSELSEVPDAIYVGGGAVVDRRFKSS